MPTPDIQIEVFGKTDVGLVREHNEDNFLVADVTGGTRTSDIKDPIRINLGAKGALLLVCDGMGGAAAGEVASQMAVDSIVGTLGEGEPADRAAFARLLRRAIEKANEKIFQQSRDNQSERGMGTTCTAAALIDGTLVVGQIGDSRCYILRAGTLAQVTKDQSLAWQLIEAGAMTTEEAKAFEHANIILQALGVQERVEVVLSQVDLRRGDMLLVCSDGLHGPVGDDEILSILKAESDIKQAGESLIKKALEHDGPDNVTLVLGRFMGEGLPEPTAGDRVRFHPLDPGREPVDDKADTPHPTRESEPKTVADAPIPPVVTAAVETAAAAGADGAAGTPAAGPSPSAAARSGLVTFVFLALVAAAAGGIFLKCSHGSPDPSVEGPGR